MPVFVKLERNGIVKVYVLKDVTAEAILNLTIKTVRRSSIVYTDRFKSYDSLMTDIVNRNSYQGKKVVTCLSCHRGSPKAKWTKIMETTDKYITIQKGRVHYIVAGSSENLGVIFLHGARFSAKDWLSMDSLTYLAKEGYGAYALDLPGFGGSERTSLMPEHFVKAFIEEVGLKRFVLVGPSMGGQIALLCTLEKIEGIVGLVLIAPSGLPSLKDRLKKIDVPVLLIWGDRDQVIPITDSEILLKETRRTRIWILNGEGHTGYFNRSREFNKILLDFLAKIADPTE